MSRLINFYLFSYQMSSDEPEQRWVALLSINLLEISEAGMITVVALIILFIFVIATVAVIVVVKKKNKSPETSALSNKKKPSDNKKKPVQKEG